MRLKKANTVGSQWVFFREGDDELKDPWAATEIEVRRVITPGELFEVVRLEPDFIPVKDRVGREVFYSELW